jgi:hypothetical protein
VWNSVNETTNLCRVPFVRMDIDEITGCLGVHATPFCAKAEVR